MTYLARNIAEKSNLQVTTDSLHAWTAAAYFQHDGQMDTYGEPFETHLAAIVLSDFLPTEVLNIRPNEILKFREKFRDERHNFIDTINEAARRISECRDQKIVADLISDLKKEVDLRVKELRNALFFLNAKEFCGIKALSLPIASSLFSALEKLDPASAQFLIYTGVALGLCTGVNQVLQSRAKLSRESDYSYLLHANAKFRDTGIPNIHYSFKEFIED